MKDLELNGADWREYRKRRNRFLSVTLLFLFVPLIVAFASVKLFNSTAPGMILAFILMGAWFFSAFQLGTWPCPQCGEVFGVVPGRRCRRCGLRKWATPGK